MSDISVYAYVGDDPMDKTDPTGLVELEAGADFDAFVGGGIKVGFSVSSDTQTLEIGYKGTFGIGGGVTWVRDSLAFRKFSALGSLIAYRGSKSEAKISVTPKTGKIVTAKYEASAKFEHGDAMIDVDLVRRGGRWQVLRFFLKSDQLPK